MFLLNGIVVSWTSKKAKIVVSSTTEAEYMALGQAAKQYPPQRRQHEQYQTNKKSGIPFKNEAY